MIAYLGRKLCELINKNISCMTVIRLFLFAMKRELERMMKEAVVA
jgi:hypothetical protein